MSALAAWSALVNAVNGRVTLGQPGVRDQDIDDEKEQHEDP